MSRLLCFNVAPLVWIVFSFSITYQVNAAEVALTQDEQAWMAQHGPVIVAGELDWAPFDFVDELGEYQGVAKDYLSLITQKTGLQFELQANPWHKNLTLIKGGHVDLLPAVYYTPERTQFLRFSSSYFETLDYFFVREGLDVTSIQDIANKRLAIPHDYANITYIRNNFPEMTIIEVETLDEAISLVNAGKADLLFDTYRVIQYRLNQKGIERIRPFLSSRNTDSKLLYFAAQKDAPELISIINKGLAAITEVEKQTISLRWLRDIKQQSTVKLTEEDKHWLNTHRTIRFTGDPNWLPYEAFNEEGEYIGIVAEYLKQIEHKLGITFERVPARTWSESVEMVKRGEVDVISETNDSILNQYLTFTDSYLSSPIVIVMRDEVSYVQDIEQISDKRIAMIKQYGYVETIKSAYPDLRFTEVDSIQAGLTAVSTGKTDALLATLAQASYHMSALGINNIRIVGQTDFSTQLAFGVQEDLKPLVSLFNRALADISLTERQLILEEWGKYKFATQLDYSLIAKVVSGAVIFFLFMVFWNRKLAREIELRKEAESQTKLLIDNLPLSIAVTNYAGKVITANPKALSDHGVKEEQLDELNMLDFYAHPEERQQVLADLREKGFIKDRIIGFRRQDGEEYPMLVSIIPIRYQHQPVLLAIAVDMKDRLMIEQELREAKEKAEIANQAKSAFLANMSHEIRTPMNAIIGFTELLQDKLSEPKLLSYVNTIHSASNDLLLLINDILDLSKIEAGKMEISKTAINPHTLFNELAHIFRLTVEKKGLDMMLDVDPLIPEGLMLDMIRLRQVLVNLLGNAIKFTEQGYVKLSASIENQDELTSRLDLRIDVEDTGMGIAQGHLETIFKDFEQTDELDRSKYAGTGLGLSISLRLTELMGGTLSVKSVLGKGSTFTVHLKQVDVTAVIQSDSKHALSDDIIFEPSTILVVDDVEYNRELVAENFVDTQVKVIQAGNGQEAIEMVDRYHPNLILMDLRMPVMDGYQAAKQIKSDSDIPVVALTASVMKDEFDNVKSTYFDGYIRKPVKQEALLACLSAYLPYTVAEKEAELEEQRLNEEEKAQLPYLFDELEAKMETWRVIEQSNNMKAIQQFATALSRLAEKTQVRLLEEYAQALLHSVDVFDIDEMDHLLKRYPRLSEELLALSR